MVSPSIAQGKMRGAADQQTCWRQLQSRQDVVRMQRETHATKRSEPWHGKTDNFPRTM